MFITFEGPDGSGKTTQIKRIVELFAKLEIPLLTTREPGGTEIGNQVREILLNMKNQSMEQRAEILLFNAARAQLVEQVLKPALAQGTTVLSDRFADSTLAYQGFGYEAPIEPLKAILSFATGGLKPDLTLLFDVPAEIGLRRRQVNQEEWNRLDDKNLQYHRRVRDGYRQLAAEEPERWVILDASQPYPAVTCDVVRCLIERGVLPTSALGAL